MRRITFKYDVPLEETMEFETVYHPNLQLDLADKKEIWETPGAFFVWMYVDGELAGESYGIPLARPTTDFLESAGLAGARGGKGSVLLFEYYFAGVPEERELHPY